MCGMGARNTCSLMFAIIISLFMNIYSSHVDVFYITQFLYVLPKPFISKLMNSSYHIDVVQEFNGLYFFKNWNIKHSWIIKCNCELHGLASNFYLV
jgi:hypothetical protein